MRAMTSANTLLVEGGTEQKTQGQTERCPWSTHHMLHPGRGVESLGPMPSSGHLTTKS